MVIDALAAEFSQGKLRCDRDGKIAASGKPNVQLLDSLLKDPYYRRQPPKERRTRTVWRGVRGADEAVEAFAARFDRYRDGAHRAQHRTTRYGEHQSRTTDLIVSGGGVHNPQIMAHLAGYLPGVSISTSSDHGVDADAKEAIAFAILGARDLAAASVELPSATGARRAAILGSITL